MKKLLLLGALFAGISFQASCMAPKLNNTLMHGLRGARNGAALAVYGAGVAFVAGLGGCLL